jgi:hypothetical protein
MSKVDWSLAPEGATHFDASNFRVNSFMKFDSSQWFYWPPASDEPHWCRWGNASRQDISDMIGRPLQPKPWSGPEDGLPPVGSTVEVFECTHDYTKRFNGQKVRILCHENDVAVFSAKNFEYHALVKDKFRPIRTEEQLAAEQRETAIREIMDIADVDCRVTAARLVDAGFKREVV